MPSALYREPAAQEHIRIGNHIRRLGDTHSSSPDYSSSDDGILDDVIAAEPVGGGEPPPAGDDLVRAGRGYTYDMAIRAEQARRLGSRVSSGPPGYVAPSPPQLSPALRNGTHVARLAFRSAQLHLYRLSIQSSQDAGARLSPPPNMQRTRSSDRFTHRTTG